MGIDSAKRIVDSGEDSERHLEWVGLRELVLQVHELEDGVIVDLPASKYEDVVDLVKRERECHGDWLTFDLTRQTNVLLLAATSDQPEGQAQIRSFMGIDGE